MWAEENFHQKLSIVLADHDALMDPVAMAMAACLCRRLQKMIEKGRLGTTIGLLQKLPTNNELELGINKLLERQSTSGIWPKYFPLFDYPDGGSNFCFTFEMLEAIIKEFGEIDGPSTSLLLNEKNLEHIDRALEWCKKNRLFFPHSGNEYKGWNSGGQPESLADREPESWATAVVYMFLHETYQFMAKAIQEKLEHAYKAKNLGNIPKNWDEIIDIPVEIDGKQSTVKKVLDDEVFNAVSSYSRFSTEAMNCRRSVLLFGPPGTSKTQFVHTFAKKLQWPLIEVDPSTFLSDGIGNIYARSKDVFEDFADLSAVVLFFDEMDAFVHTRDNRDEPFDLASRFLTTSMLPKLAKLHDDGKVVFFFATNNIDAFDPAIKRPGRFDVLLCVGPPSWEAILNNLEKVVKGIKNTQDVDNIRNLLKGFTSSGGKTLEILNMLTFSETKRFIELLTEKKGDTPRSIDVFNKKQFTAQVINFEKTITLSKTSKPYESFQKQRKTSRLQ
jgi:hypothetical protein